MTRIEKLFKAMSLVEDVAFTLESSTTSCGSCGGKKAKDHEHWRLYQKLCGARDKLRDAATTLEDL